MEIISHWLFKRKQARIIQKWACLSASLFVYVSVAALRRVLTLKIFVRLERDLTLVGSTSWEKVKVIEIKVKVKSSIVWKHNLAWNLSRIATIEVKFGMGVRYD